MTIRTNSDRADRALRGLRAYKGTDWCENDEPGRDEIQEALGDLLCDLHHLADQGELGWDDLLDRGAMHHHAEVADEAEDAAEDAPLTFHQEGPVAISGGNPVAPVPYEDSDQRLGGNDA